jgi:SAM-dependent methyltransferase
MADDLRHLERVWERLAEDDPFWAALTDDARRGGGWSIEEFFASGEAEIAAVLLRATEHGWLPRYGRALDFGCGAGRLSQALATRFDRVDGVDISGAMVAAARRLNRHGDRSVYHRHAAPELGLFDAGAFDFVYSAVTLQHIPPALARRYITELVRVLAVDGLLVFQLPSHRAPVEPAAGATRTIALGRLPPAAFSARLSLEDDATRWRAGETRLLRVSVENAATAPWPAGSRDDGRYRVQVGNRWLDAAGRVVVANDGRTPLPHDLAPGRKATVFLEVTAPTRDGACQLEIDMVQEHVAWFQERGSRPMRVACLVIGGAATPAAAPRRRFADRYPRLHAMLVGAGLDAMRGGYRRWRERVRTGRWQRAAMVMHCVPRAEVIALLERAGASVLDVEQALTPGGYQSCRYWATKRPVAGRVAAGRGS